MDWQHWPNVEYGDIYHYLVTTHSTYTQDQLKSYKSLDAYNFFVNGWIANITVASVPRANSYLVRAKVRHSQKLSAPSLQPWVGVEKDGKVLCAHCTCKAGLGEACSHIAALLFAVDANTRITRHRRCLCLGGMLCIHACLTKYAELKYTSSNESLLLLVEHYVSD